MEKDKIEIPFGAFNSELGGREYTIPDGYEAEIKYGKVIVRKAESEDEKIRKDLIRHIRQERGSLSNDEASKCIEWLEKQGEPKQVEVRPFNKVFSKEQIDEIDKRIETEIKLYNAKLMDAQMRAKDFPMTD